MTEQKEISSDTETAPFLPSHFQKRTLWMALTALAIVAIGSVAVGFIMLGATVLSFLQPVLVPLAVAGIIAYLLEPIIAWLVRRGWKQNRAVLAVYIGFLILITLLVIAVIVPTFGQAQEVYTNRDAYRERIVGLTKQGVDALQSRFGTLVDQKYWDQGVEKISQGAFDINSKIMSWAWERVRGVFGFFGYLLGLLLVPIYLFYFLREGHKIAKNWSDYLPLRASTFKDEVVATLQEINGYLISFFRGQMVVSLIDGFLVAIALYLFGLPYALLIGVFLAILGLIPYIGNLMVMAPSVLIAVAHFGSTEWGVVQGTNAPEIGQVAQVKLLTGGEVVEKTVTEITPDGKKAAVLVHAYNWIPHVWFYPLAVLLIFIILQQINGLVTAPKIVGESVGLHPLTVIFSVLFWSLILGGLLGALLAVPLTASIKVLFRRYIWEKRLEAAVERRLSGGDEQEDHSDQSGSESEPATA